jgi:hypothetical protein
MLATELQLSAMSECILHELPTEAPQVQTLSRPHEQREYRMLFVAPAEARAFWNVWYHDSEFLGLQQV